MDIHSLLFTHSLIHSFTHLHSLLLSFTVIHSLTHSDSLSVTHSLLLTVIHSLTHSDSLLLPLPLTEGSVVKQKFTSHTKWVPSVRWSTTSEHLFVSGGYDHLIKVWDVRR